MPIRKLKRHLSSIVTPNTSTEETTLISSEPTVSLVPHNLLFIYLTEWLGIIRIHKNFIFNKPFNEYVTFGL